MLKRTTLVILLLGLSVVNGQFYYNYEEDRADEPPAESQEYDPSLYQYNPPTAVNQQFVRSRDTESPPQRSVTRRISRVRSRQPEPKPEPDYDAEPQPVYAPEPVPEEQTRRQERRQSRRRQRQRNYVEPTQPPRIYGPSIFEKIPLGEAPNGVYVPQDSLLNVLKNPGRRNIPVQSYEPAPVVSQPNRNSVTPAINYVNREPQQRFFVQPPSNDEDTRQRNVILPIVRTDTQYAVPPAPRVSSRPRNVAPSRTQPTTMRVNQNHRAQPAHAPQPTIDIDSYREYTDDVIRQDVQVMPETRSQSKPRIQVRRRQVFRSSGYPEPTQPPRVYSPSVFENVGLGEAPSGIYVPEDSLLNVLRNPTRRRHISSRAISEEPQEQFSRQPSEEKRVRSEVNYVSVAPVEQDPSEFTPRRRSGQRSRQAHVTRPTSQPRQEYQERYGDQEPVAAVQTSSQRRTRVNDNDSIRRQGNNVQERRNSQPQRRQQTEPASKPQLQATSSRRDQSSFKPAKLAIAELPSDTDGDGIPGEAGVNYPTLHVIPQTAFSCSQQPHNGYYADLETSCQVVHLCQSGGVQDSFLCPNGTIFSQEKFSCQWWYKVNCADSPRFYAINDNLYKVPEKKDKKRN